MQLLATAGQMQAIDRTAISHYSLPGLLLMENAGRKFVDVLLQHAGTLAGKTITILCGKGNNGGDGFVIARHAANYGANVNVFLLGRFKDVAGDAATNLKTLRKLASHKSSRIVAREVLTRRGLPSADPDIIVDALFGTGFRGEVRGVYADAIEWANRSSAYRAAVDIASGVDASTGVVGNVAFRANLTITMGVAKIGQYVGEGREHSGRTEIADIGFPHFVIRPEREQVYRVAVSDVCARLPRRPLRAHKNSVGRVFVLAGSRSLSGAPVMTAEAAMRSGVGAVILGVPQSLHTIVARKVTEVMVMPLDESDAGTVSLSAHAALKEKFDWADVVVVGPGLSTHPETVALVEEILPVISKPLILDADGINACAGKFHLIRKRSAPTILTPHVGEFRRLFREIAGDVDAGRVLASQRAARMSKSVVCLKGAPTCVASPEGNVYVNSTGNPGMATAGAGDVLTGIIAALSGEGMAPVDAALCGVFLHGAAGDIAAQKFGQRSLMALDILESIPDAFRLVSPS